MCRYLKLLHRLSPAPILFSLIDRKPIATSEKEEEEAVKTEIDGMESILHRMVSVNGINMHVVEKGDGPVVLFIHGFPELWYSWRHQILGLASLGYRAIAPDLRGYGDTDSPESPTDYTCLHIVGDLIALLDAIVGEEEKVFVVGHDWGAMIAWYLCLYRPDRVKSLVNMSVAFNRRNPKRKPLESLRAGYGEDYYICRFQDAGEIEREFAEIGTERVIREILTYRSPKPLMLAKGKAFGSPLEVNKTSLPLPLPPWLSQEDIDYYASKYEKKGFTGPINYYRNLDRNWELNAPFNGAKVKVAVKFIVGDLDLTYNSHGTKEYIHSGEMKKDVPFLEEVVIMEGVGHFIQSEKPDEITHHIYDFIKNF